MTSAIPRAERLLTQPEAAALCGLHLHTLIRARRAGELRYVQIGRASESVYLISSRGSTATRSGVTPNPSLHLPGETKIQTVSTARRPTVLDGIEGVLADADDDIVDAELVKAVPLAIPPSDREWAAEVLLPEDSEPSSVRGNRYRGR